MALRLLLPKILEACDWPVQRLLREQPIEAKIQTGFRAANASLSAFARLDPVFTPGIVGLRSNRTLRVLHWLSRRAGRDLHALLDLREDLQDQLGDLLRGTPQPPPPEPDDSDEDEPDDTGGEGEPDDEDGEGDDDQDDDASTAPRDSEPEPEADESEDRDADDGSEPLDLPPQNETSDDEPPELESDDEGSAGGGNGAGKGGHGGGAPLSSLELLSELDTKGLSKLTNILAHMQQFETALKTKRFARVDENASTADLLPTFGNDISRVDASELALLHNPATAPLFYAKLADHALLLRAPLDAKRQPIAMALDASGSMSGVRYEIAAGFALAMIKLLRADSRGASLTIFSGSAAPSIIMRPNEAFDLRNLMIVLLSPYFGGTSFDAAVGEMYRVKLLEKWKSMTAILITDGGDALTGAMTARIKDLKTREDRLVAVICGSSGSDAGLHGLNDETLRAEKKNLQFTLTRLGNSLL